MRSIVQALQAPVYAAMGLDAGPQNKNGAFLRRRHLRTAGLDYQLS